MKVLTHSPVPSLLMLMSTGNGIFVGSSMTATSFACHSPEASGLMSQSFEVSAVAVIAQVSPSLSDHRISSGAPGTLRTFFGFIALRSQTAMVFPKRFMASASFTSSPRFRM